jgi:hypothetical protein
MKRSYICQLSTAVSRQLLSKGYRPILLNDLKSATAFADGTIGSGLSVSALCDHIAHDRIYVTSKISSNPNFMYTDVSEASHLLPDTERSSDPTKIVNIEIDDLRQTIQNNNNNNNNNSTSNNNTSNNNNDTQHQTEKFMYFTSLLKDVAPTYYKTTASVIWRDLHLNTKSSEENNGDGEPPLTVWMGSTGVITQAHYDTEDNIFVQASGRKRFQFFSPKQSTKLCLYPDAHPRARKSQINFDHDMVVNDESNSNSNSTSTSTILSSGLPKPDMELTLNPGECLYIPAFWFHRVTTLSPSVSINLFSPSSVWAQNESILSMSTPFNDLVGEEAVISMYAFIENLLPHLGFCNPKKFVMDLVESRYTSLACAAEEEKGNNNDVDNDDDSEFDDWDDDCYDDDGGGDEDENYIHDFLDERGDDLTVTKKITCSDDVCEGVVFRRCTAAFVKEFTILETIPGGEEAKILIVSHLIELWAVRIAGATGVHNTLRRYEGFSFC